MSNPAQETTFIAPHTFIKGELHLGGPTAIAGRVEGTIISQDQLEITSDGLIEGDIQGTVLDIHGSVKGNVVATRSCRLGATAKVSGELRAATLSFAEGACFIGQVYVGGGAAQDDVETPVEAPKAQAPSPAVINRIETMAADAEELTAVTMATTTQPTIRINSAVVQQTLQQRAPRIIRARS